MTKDEALRLALEAMKINNKEWKLLADSGDAGNWEAEEQGHYQLNEQAIKAIKEALETKDEPMACAECGVGGGHALYCMACAEKYISKGTRMTEEDEEFKRIESRIELETQPLINFTKQKEWVGLTDEEIYLIAWPHGGETMQAIIKHTILQAEQLLKEKNI